MGEAFWDIRRLFEQYSIAYLDKQRNDEEEWKNIGKVRKGKDGLSKDDF